MAEPTNRQKDIFLKALEIPPAERAAFLIEACTGDEALRRQVEALLAAQGIPDSFLEKPAATLEATTLDITVGPDDASPAEPPARSEAGTRINQYKLLQQIGEGGMGVVYMAEQQEPVKRLVALKIIKPGMDSAQVLARFEAERQALALMDHPNIAKVHDAGVTHDARPYFVMELIKGTPITAYCDERRLTPRQRLELFIPVCQAVQHAHQKGIIHRDLKPSNVLIALYDGKPVPKVIDFGVAKATGQQLTERTLFTGFGAIIGTLAYMSPEQAELNQLDIDTRSDIYSLGVMLYELLTGSTPIEQQRLRNGAILEVLRLIREEEPPRPSTRISTTQALATLSAQRQTEPAKLAKLVRGDIDWIVMKALDKDRSRRYETAAVLGQDIERYLKDEPVEASPPSAFYRVRKFVKRHRGAVLAAALLLLALLGGIGGTTWGLIEARRQRDEAVQARLDETAQRMRAVAAEKQARHNEALARTAEERATRQARRAETALHAIQMDLIYRAWESDHILQATQALEKVPEAFRPTWEYRYLRALCRRTAIPLTLDEHAHCWAFSPDGKTVATGHSQTLKLWDPSTGQERKRLPHSGTVMSLVFSRDSQRLAAMTHSPIIGVPSSVKVWEVATGKALLNIELPLNSTRESQAFSPRGDLLATTWFEGVLLLDGHTGKEKLRLKESHPVDRVAFSPDGKRLAAAGKLVGVKIYALESGTEQLTLKLPQETEVHTVVFSPDSKRILTFQIGDRLTAWNVEPGKTAAKMLDLQGKLAESDAGFTADGRFAVLARPNTIKILDLHSGQERAPPTPLGPTTCATLSPNGQWLARGDFVYSLVKPTPEKYALAGWERGLTTTPIKEFSRDGQRIYAWSDGALTCWNAATGEQERTVQLDLGPWRPWQMTADGQSVAHYDPDTGLLRILYLDTGKEQLRISTLPRWARAGARSRAGQWVAFGGADGKVKVWNARTGQEHLSFPMTALITSLAFGPDGQYLAAGNSAGGIQVWHVPRGEKKLALQVDGHLRQITFFADGKYLLAWFGTEITIWDCQTGARQIAFSIGDGSSGILLSPDGRRIFHGNKIWDVATGQEVFTLPGGLSAAALSPDGRRLLTSHPSGARVLEAP